MSVRTTDYALTLALMRWLVTVEHDDGNLEMWSIVEVATNGDVLLRREWDDHETRYKLER